MASHQLFSYFHFKVSRENQERKPKLTIKNVKTPSERAQDSASSSKRFLLIIFMKKQGGEFK